MKRLFVDMDGSIAQFYERPDWHDHFRSPGFFLNLKAYPNMIAAIRALMERYDIRVYFLSAVESEAAAEEKQQWLAKHFPNYEPIGCFFPRVGENKAKYLMDFFEQLSGNDYLLDDYSKNLIEWESYHGTGIKALNEFNGKGINGTHFSGHSINVFDSARTIYQQICEIMGIESNIPAEPVTLTIMVGLPGSGKSTMVQALSEIEPSCVVVSSEAIRKELFGDEQVQSGQDRVFALANKRIREALANNKSVLYDATNLYFKSRKSVLDIIPSEDVTVIFMVLTTPLEECLSRNRLRDRKVPEDVIRRMAKRFSMPTVDEWKGTCVVTQCSK